LVSLDEAIIARMNKGEDHFETLVDPHAVEKIIEVKDEDILSIPAIEAIFTGSKKGDYSHHDSFLKFWGINYVKRYKKGLYRRDS